MPAADDIPCDSEDDETLQFNTEAEANARAAVVVSPHRWGYLLVETPSKCTYRKEAQICAPPFCPENRL